MNAGQEKIGLQFLRGICALAVVVDHAAGMAGSAKYFGQDFLHGYLTYGASGVDIFFVISGYIITISSLSSENLRPSLTRSDFFKKRFIRIVPLMWISILSYAILRVVGTNTHVDLQSYINALFLIPNGDVDPNQIWTLRHEAIFYILFSLSFLGERASRLFIVVWVLSPFVNFFYVMTSHSIVVKDTPSAILFDPVNLEFGMGLCFGVWSLKRPDVFAFKSKIHPLIALLILSILVFAIGGICAEHMDRLFAKGITGIFATLVVIIATYAYCPPGRITWLGEFLGAASYSIYLFHSHFASALLSALTKFASWLPIGVVILVVSVGATVMSIAIYLLVERPLLKSLKRKFTRRAETRSIA